MTKPSTTRKVPRLDATALKTVSRTMRQNKPFMDLVQGTPFYKELVQTVHENLKRTAAHRLSESKDVLKFVFARFLHVSLVHSLMVLLSHEPDCLVVFSNPRRRQKVEVYTDLDDHHRRFYLVDVYKGGDLFQQLSFWDKDGFVSYLIGLWSEQLPKEISVFRSSIPIAGPVHTFLRQVGEAFGETKVPPRIVRIYNKHMAQLV